MALTEYKPDQISNLKAFFRKHVERRFVVSALGFHVKKQRVLYVHSFAKDTDLQSYVARYLQCNDDEAIYQSFVKPIYIQYNKANKPTMDIELDGHTCFDLDVAAEEFLYTCGAKTLDDYDNPDIQHFIFVSEDENEVGNIGGPLELGIAQQFARKRNLEADKKENNQPYPDGC